MVITREADYAVRLMVGLAKRTQGTVVSARALSDEAGVPYELARTILGNLADAGILESRRGRSGGFLLARSASQIQLREVLAVAGENLQLNICVADPTHCGRSSDCPVHPIWTAASAVLREFMSSQTLADLANSKEPVEAPC
ncbi:MAG: Rrf2 family transcriptional regulator [Coriobacteriia bacterium]|nr:Rrf2 family transcriptional regulator [Coriobacteriia bacterium]